MAEKVTFETPAMYGDHHVIEVRRILLELPGIQDVYASSCFHVVEVSYDPALITPDTIRASLEEAGYLEELPAPAEAGVAATADSEGAFFRHTAVYEQTRQVVSFTQQVDTVGRPLWPCPGMGVLGRLDKMRD